jgi:predicted lipid-binding transport protein (Tim44 family)
MNETGDLASHILFIAIVAFYWALLGSWTGLPRPGDDKPEMADAPAKSTVKVGETSAVAAPLDEIREIDRDFDVDAFLAGAGNVYELVVQAYAQGDVATLARFVGPEVLDVFERAIAGRRQRQERLELTLIGMNEAKVVSVLGKDGMTEIVVRFACALVSAVRAADDAVLSGDPRQIVEVVDAWTFARDIRSADPDWRIVATDAG